LFIDGSKRGISVGFPFEEEAGVGFALAIAYKDLKKEKKNKKITKNNKEGNKNQRSAAELFMIPYYSK